MGHRWSMQHQRGQGAEPDGDSGATAAAALLRPRRGQRRPAGWHPVTRGVCRRVDAEDPWLSDLAAWGDVLPDDARWTHLTAARIRGWWLPPLPEATPVYTAHGPRHRVRRTGLRASRRQHLGPLDDVVGLPVDPAPMILVVCARDLGELDLACLVAGALATGDCTIADIATVAATKRPGMTRLRRVLQRTGNRFESIWEVLLAELHHVCGIDVVPQHNVYGADGAFVARGDLWLTGTRMLHEYDGAHHRTSRGQHNDLRRESRLRLAGWQRQGYNAHDVLHGAVHILADADHAVGRTHDPRRIRAWHTLLRGSLFTPAGTATFLRRTGSA